MVPEQQKGPLSSRKCKRSNDENVLMYVYTNDKNGCHISFLSDLVLLICGFLVDISHV